MWATIIIVIMGIELCICMYALIRNQWVYENRVALIGTKYYEQLSEYEEILQGHKFWCWDFKSYYIQ